MHNRARRNSFNGERASRIYDIPFSLWNAPDDIADEKGKTPGTGRQAIRTFFIPTRLPKVCTMYKSINQKKS